MTEHPSPPGPPDEVAPDFRHLPAPVAPEDMVATVDTRAVPDPDGGRDPNHEWFLRHLG